MINIIKKYSVYILLGLSISLNFIQRSCSNSTKVSKPTTIKVKTSEIKGSIKESTIKELDGTANKIQYKDKIAYVENPITQKLLTSYIKENDSLKRLKMYGEAITIHKQTNTFEDKNLKVEVESETQGKLLDMSLLNYTIKPQEVPITLPPSKQTVSALNAGGGIYYNTESQKVNYKAGFTFQNKKGDQLSLESDFQKQPTVFIDYKFRIFNIKK